MEKRISFSEFKGVTDFSEMEMSPRDAIYFKCLDCCCYQPSEANACDIKTCPLWRFKEKHFGRLKKGISEEKKRHLREILELNRKSAQKL